MAATDIALLLIASLAAFTVSSSAGLGGSLIMVPSLMVIFGPRQGVALAALLLSLNNGAKLVAYRHSLPIRKALPVVVPTIVGSFIGAWFLTLAPEQWVVVAVLASLTASLVAELVSGSTRRVLGAPLLAGTAGVTSGFSGTSGPLKGVAVRGLGLDRTLTVGAATLASLAGDVTKTLAFTHSGLLTGRHMLMAAMLVPLMIGGTAAGYHMNGRLGDRGYAKWFWLIIGGYGLRLIGLWPT